MTVLVNAPGSFLESLGAGLGQGISKSLTDQIEERLKREMLEFQTKQQQELLRTKAQMQPPSLSPFEKKGQELAAQRVGDFVKAANEEGEAAQRILQSVSEVNKAFASGNVGFANPRNIARNIFSVFGEIPPNADEATVEAAGISFLERAKPLFGRVTEGEVLILKEAIPNLNDTVEGARAKAAIWEKAAKLGLQRQELVKQIINQNNGIPPIDIDRQVENALMSQRTALIQEADAIGKGDFNQAVPSLPEGHVRVRGPKGEAGSIPAEQAQRLIQQGVNLTIEQPNQSAQTPQRARVAQPQQPMPVQPQAQGSPFNRGFSGFQPQPVQTELQRLLTPQSSPTFLNRPRTIEEEIQTILNGGLI
jgi:hypothetical protein